MADLMQKYVHLNNAGYNEAIFQIEMAKVLFYNKAQTRVASLKRWDCFCTYKFKMAAVKPGILISQLLD